MVVNKRLKNTRQRAHHTHGWGHKKKHRGAGSRGGRGMAGTGKKGDAKKPCIWKIKKYFGRFGFRPRNDLKVVNVVNLAFFEEKADLLVEKKLIEKQGDVFVINAKKLGFDKILTQGKITKKFEITADAFSKKAIEKIQAAGGKVIMPKQVKQEPVEVKKEATPEQ